MQPGQILNKRFELISLIGSGGQGSVWRGLDRVLNAPVALKMFDKSSHADRERAAKEARILANLRTSSRTVRVFDIDRHGDMPFIIMELVDGEPLSAHVGRGRHLTLEQTARWTKEICKGLSDIHDQGVTHQDIKPANVLLDGETGVKIVDFGIARFVDATASYKVRGTLQYMSPEQFRGERVTPAADLYALGCVLYEMLTGATPFAQCVTLEAITNAHCTRTPMPLADSRPGVPEALEVLVRRLLEKAPGARPIDARAVLRLVEELETIPLSRGEPHVDRRHVAEIQRLERLIRLDHAGSRAMDPHVLDARSEHARLTGESGDARGAALLYDQLAEDCAKHFGSTDRRVFEAYREAKRWAKSIR
ncbi:serine/threonine-protein kinase [Streptomyces siamensis]|uniref:non-specific serine/threonine protein kinase n=1 Tax=Streptomyces siamensis TaxID=1274986 RepID=A0ABP9J5V4_9ACTN